EQISSIKHDQSSLTPLIHSAFAAGASIVRLLPVPGLTAGQATGFDFDYFAPPRVFPLPGE
ncbi:MAG TPA: hypothetical protein DCF45_11395, partial [Gammaproteobacteria bacterium]|nr:hypothetical protein [Gammaproteobacteria bacterium]